MARVHTSRRPDDFRAGDVLLTDRGHPATIIRLNARKVTVRLGSLHFEVDRKALRRHGAVNVKGRTFHIAPEGARS